MKEDNKWLLITAIIGVLGVLLGAYITGLMNEKSNVEILRNQQQNERKTLANEYLNDLNYIERAESNFENYLFDPNSSFNDPKSPTYHRTISWQDPIYPSWGMYHSNRQDISKFDANLSKNLISFYGLVLTAESERQQYNNYDSELLKNKYLIDKYESSLEENHLQNQLRIFNNMADNINKSRPMISQLRIDLQNVANS